MVFFNSQERSHSAKTTKKYKVWLKKLENLEQCRPIIGHWPIKCDYTLRCTVAIALVVEWKIWGWSEDHTSTVCPRKSGPWKIPTQTCQPLEIQICILKPTNLYFSIKTCIFKKTYTNRLNLPHFITRIFITSIVIHFMPHCPFSPHYCGVSQLQCAVLCRIFHLQQCWNQRNTTYTLHGFLPSLTALWSPSCANTPPWKSVFFYFWTPSHL